MLSNFGLSFETNDSVYLLCDKLQSHCQILSQRPRCEISAVPQLPTPHIPLQITKDTWPQLVSQSQKDILALSFKNATSFNALHHRTCATCARYLPMKKTAIFSCHSLNSNPL